MQGLVNFWVYSIKMIDPSDGEVPPPVVLLVEYPFSLIAIFPVTDPFLLCKWKHVPYSHMRSTCPSECVEHFLRFKSLKT